MSPAYRLVLADDEHIVREGISKCLDWRENGFDLVGVFENGAQVLDFVASEAVDVVLSDISMPKLDGLALSRELFRSYPDVTVLLLTGFDEFEYAQEALKYRVADFLLKPITADELAHVLHNCRVRLDAERAAAGERALLEEKLRQSFPLLRDRFLAQVVSGDLRPGDVHGREEFFQWKDRRASYVVVVVSPPSDWSDLERITLRTRAEDATTRDDAVFVDRRENIVLLLQGSENNLELRSRTLAARLFASAGRSENHASVGIGRVVGGIEELPTSLQSARNALDYTRVLGVSRVVSVADIPSAGPPTDFRAYVRRIEHALREEGREHVERSLSDALAYLENHFVSIAETDRALLRLEFAITDFAHEMGFELNAPTAAEDERSRLFRYLQEIDAQIHRSRHRAVLSRVEHATQLIDERFTDPEFSIQNAAQELFISSRQLSGIFKDGTGKTFLEALTDRRIAEAKQLLKSTDMMAYEVAERVGYQDARYFSIVFKKKTGLTVTDYRHTVAT